MSLLDKITSFFTVPGNAQEFAYYFKVKCNRCGEIILGRVDLRNEPSINYDENGKKTYFCRKILIGDGLCFQRIETEFTFDAKYNIIDRKIQGGTFADDE